MRDIDILPLLHIMPAGCVLFDDNGIIQSVNNSLSHLLEYPSQELIGKHIEYIFTVSSRILYQTQVYPSFKLNEKVDEVALSLKSKQGKTIPVLFYCNRTVVEEKIRNVCIIVSAWERQKQMTEISEAKRVQQIVKENETLKKLKEELEIHEQQLDRQIFLLLERNQEHVQLNKVLSHDLQEQIRKIGVFSDLLQSTDELRNNSESKSHLQKIQKSVLKLQNLIRSLQLFVHLDSIEERLTQLKVEDIIKEAKKEAINGTGFNDFILEVGEISSFEGRSYQMKLLFTELFKNAIQNRNPDNRLAIHIESLLIEENMYLANNKRYRYTEHIRIKISDNGDGFENQYSSYIFGLFNKLNTKTDRVGLGLALVKHIVSYHYGTITATSEVGKGSSFIIVLPILQPK
ncbi:ATP-binding protein [Emticicia agri]|uniref:histidine kinase n=1 Tax=Emticicia agri TaxID=2492393 RepID=A0A4Q5LT74_9BACT|nr:ATP-binding protein [Emticicia agri]RYU92603.1 PAS domain-containing sensor histidine kinase [Emticicia agri]